jgi:hypothetical protein
MQRVNNRMKIESANCKSVCNPFPSLIHLLSDLSLNFSFVIFVSLIETRLLSTLIVSVNRYQAFFSIQVALL